MPTLQVKLTKNPEDPWILLLNTYPGLEYFTQDQIDTILKPYINAVKELPGLLNISESIEENTLTLSYEFDTNEHLINSRSLMIDSNLAKSRSTLLNQIMLANGIQPYTVKVSIV